MAASGHKDGGFNFQTSPNYGLRNLNLDIGRDFFCETVTLLADVVQLFVLADSIADTEYAGGKTYKYALTELPVDRARAA